MSDKNCCGQPARWVENVTGKGYWFCGECRTEVVDSEVLLAGIQWADAQEYEEARQLIGNDSVPNPDFRTYQVVKWGLQPSD